MSGHHPRAPTVSVTPLAPEMPNENLKLSSPFLSLLMSQTQALGMGLPGDSLPGRLQEQQLLLVTLAAPVPSIADTYQTFLSAR